MTRCILTLEVLKDYLLFRLNEKSTGCCSTAAAIKSKIQSEPCNCKYVKSESLEMIRILAMEAEVKNREIYDNCITYQLIEYKKDYNLIAKNIQNTGEKLFDDNCINWGRIIAFISFLGYYNYRFACCIQNYELASAFSMTLIEWFTYFLTCKVGMWIEANGGWVSEWVSYQSN